jgi:DNA repair exonuclease SbcCD nuclease subunit
MKIGFIGDIHLQVQDPYSNLDSSTGFSIRTLDKFDGIKEALSISKLEGVDLFAFLGDIFDKMNPNEKLKSHFYEVLLPYLKYFPIIIIPGNHDGIQVSHSFLTEQAILNQLEYKELIIADEPMIYKDKILFIPWNNDIEGLTELITENADENLIVLGHLEINGAVTSTEHITGKGLSPIIFSKYRFVGLSHYHKYQKIKKNIWYIGSPAIKDFSEIGIEKGFGIYDYTKNKLIFHTLEKRSFYEFNINEDTVEEVGEYLEKNTIPEGSVFKLRIKGSKNWLVDNKSTIIDVFKEYKPLKIIPKTEIVKDETSNIEYIKSHTNRYEKIKEFANGKPQGYIDYGIQIYKRVEQKFLEM